MTAEIAIMNKEAVALAADSAATIPQEGAPKIFASANKLFALSRYHPVGIMVYGSGSFMGVPWDTVIKLFRARMGDMSCSTIQVYAEKFVSFLQSEPTLAPESSQESYVRSFLDEYFGYMVRQIQSQITESLNIETPASQEEIQQLFRVAESKTIDRHYRLWRDAKHAKGLNAAIADSLKKKYRSVIRHTKESRFGSHLTQSDSRKLTRFSGWILSKYAYTRLLPGESGVVIAGFGEEQIFPSIRSFKVSGIAGGTLKYEFEDKSADISVEMTSTIMPFAQDEMVRSFMEGIEPDYWSDILGAFRRLLDEYPRTLIDSIQGLNEQEKERLNKGVTKASEEAFEAFTFEFSDLKRTRYVDPVIDTIESMPKSELPAVAEALVNLQSFKRRVSGEQETVGGPIDVMLISKGDGLIWIKRKHYFDRAMNPQYLQAAFKEASIEAGSLDLNSERTSTDE